MLEPTIGLTLVHISEPPSPPLALPHAPSPPLPPLDPRTSPKVIYILLKRKCLQVMHYINEGGLELFRKFVRHLGNYSIMQIVERLFLHQPGWDREGRSVGVAWGRGRIGNVCT